MTNLCCSFLGPRNLLVAGNLNPNEDLQRIVIEGGNDIPPATAQTLTETNAAIALTDILTETRIHPGNADPPGKDAGRMIAAGKRGTDMIVAEILDRTENPADIRTDEGKKTGVQRGRIASTGTHLAMVRDAGRMQQ